MKLVNFKDSKQMVVYYTLAGLTFLDFLIFKEKYLSTQLIIFACWLIFYLKSPIEELLPIKTAIIFLTISAFFYLISQIELSEHFLNAGIVFVLLAVADGFAKEIRKETNGGQKKI